MGQMVTLVVGTVLLDEVGEQRLAVRYYQAASQHPYFARSAWFAKLVEKQRAQWASLVDEEIGSVEELGGVLQQTAVCLLAHAA